MRKQQYYTLTEYAVHKYRKKSQRISIRRWYKKGLIEGEILNGVIYIKDCLHNDDFIKSKIKKR